MRERLHNRRGHEAVTFRHAGHQFKAGIGRFDDGRLAEIFIDAAKSGAAIEGWARDSAIVASLALQHGVEVDTIRHALSRNPDGSAATPLGEVLDLLTAEGGHR